MILLLLLLRLLLLLIHSRFGLDTGSTVRRSGDVVLVAAIGSRRHAISTRVWQSGIVDRLLLLLLLMVLLHLRRRLLHRRNGFGVPRHLSDTSP